MYKLGTPPSISGNISELADFIEAQCLFSDEGIYSLTSAKSALSIESDELNHEGIDSEDDRILRKLEDVLVEIRERSVRTRNKYPFQIEHSAIKLNRENKLVYYIYSYLLLATRSSMQGNKRIAAEIDGALLFEELSEIVAKSYFGENTDSLIFGTSVVTENSFRDKIDTLLRALGEGGTFKNPVGSTGKQNDGKLDIVVWKPFRDNRGSQLIGFGQCKTGTSWRNSIGQLYPSAFLGSYTTCSTYHDPVRLFFVAESCMESWEETARVAGILFDRCRCMKCLPDEIPAELFDRVKKWVDVKIVKEEV